MNSIGVSLLVDLKLGESDEQRAEIFCDCGESTERHDLLWVGISALGAVAFAVSALYHGEQVNALWLVVQASR